MRACWLKWVGRDWSISADYIWLNYSGANIGVGKIDQAVVAGLGAKRKVVYIAAQGVGDLHVTSNPSHSWRADALILYVRSVVGDHDAMAPKLVG